jgi:hypothetical protein
MIFSDKGKLIFYPYRGNSKNINTSQDVPIVCFDYLYEYIWAV